MKSNRIIVYCFTVAFLLLTVFCFVVMNDADASSVLSVEVVSRNDTEQIKCFENSSNEIYVFLPSYAQLSDVNIIVNDHKVWLDGVALQNKTSCEQFALDTEYELIYTDSGKQFEKKLFFKKSQNVATMYIDTQSQSMDYIHSKKGNTESGDVRLYTPDGTPDYRGDINSINGRGNYTWNGYDKKPYSITLAQEGDLLRMGAASKWILIANADDESNLRDKLIYDLADEIGLLYSPDSTWVDLYLNGEYAGLYLLSERNEIHSQRVDINEQGSVLVSMEQENRLKEQGYMHIVTDNAQALRVHHPEKITDEELVELKDTFQSVENAVMAEDGIDPVTGKHYTELIDMDSFCRKYLIEEVSGNWDACFISQYFYYDSDDSSGKLYASPVWDYGLSMGNRVNWGNQSPNIMYGNQLYIRDHAQALWFYGLYQKPEFYDKVVDLYETEVLPKTKTMLSSTIYDHANVISQAHNLNRIRWGLEDISAEDEAQYISDFMQRRLEFLSNVWLKDTEYHTVRLHHNGYANYIVFDGESLPQLPVIEDTADYRFIGWYDEATDEPVVENAVVHKDMNIYAKCETTKSEMFKEALKVAPVFLFVFFLCLVVIIDFRRNKKR